MFKKKTTKTQNKPLKGAKSVKKAQTTKCSTKPYKTAPKQAGKVDFKKNGTKQSVQNKKRAVRGRLKSITYTFVN